LRGRGRGRGRGRVRGNSLCLTHTHTQNPFMNAEQHIPPEYEFLKSAPHVSSTVGSTCTVFSRSGKVLTYKQFFKLHFFLEHIFVSMKRYSCLCTCREGIWEWRNSSTHSQYEWSVS